MCTEMRDQDIQDMMEDLPLGSRPEIPVHETGPAGSRLKVTTEDFDKFKRELTSGLTSIQESMKFLEMVAEIPISKDAFYRENIQFEIVLGRVFREVYETRESILRAGRAIRDNSLNYLVGGDKDVDRRSVEDAHEMRVNYEQLRQEDKP